MPEAAMGISRRAGAVLNQHEREQMGIESDFDSKDVIPIAAFFGPNDDPDVLTPNPAIDYEGLIGASDLIFGVNVMEHRRFIVYGRELLAEIANGGEERDIRVLHIGIDQETDELEKLIVLVQLFKGSDDYKAFDEPSP